MQGQTSPVPSNIMVRSVSVSPLETEGSRSSKNGTIWPVPTSPIEGRGDDPMPVANRPKITIPAMNASGGGNISDKNRVILDFIYTIADSLPAIFTSLFIALSLAYYTLVTKANRWMQFSIIASGVSIICSIVLRGLASTYKGNWESIHGVGFEILIVGLLLLFLVLWEALCTIMVVVARISDKVVWPVGCIVASLLVLVFIWVKCLLDLPKILKKWCKKIGCHASQIKSNLESAPDTVYTGYSSGEHSGCVNGPSCSEMKIRIGYCLAHKG